MAPSQLETISSFPSTDRLPGQLRHSMVVWPEIPCLHFSDILLLHWLLDIASELKLICRLNQVTWLYTCPFIKIVKAGEATTPIKQMNDATKNKVSRVESTTEAAKGNVS